jgi:hypothetical protein
MLNGILYLYYSYKNLQKQMIDKTANDPSIWKNDYPIVLVHGYCGTTMDENWILGGYFHYAFSSVSRYLNPSSDSEKFPKYLDNIFEADVSPIGSAHDRACELY